MVDKHCSSGTLRLDTVLINIRYLLALASSSLGISEPALAQCAGPADNTICTLGGNPYASGINLSAGLAQALRLAMYEP